MDQESVFKAVADFSEIVQESEAGAQALDHMGESAEAVGDSTERGGSRAAKVLSSLGKGILKVAKWAAVGFAAVGAAILGVAIKGGISRALNIEDAQAKLAALGHSTKSVQGIMKSALASVKGTAFALDEAATTAAGAVAAGIKRGGDLTKYLKSVADTATIAGVDMSDMGSIFNKVMTRGKLDAEVMNQVQEKGIPLQKYLMKQTKMSAAEFQKAMRAGKISSEMFRKAIEDNLGGAALRSAKTTRGAYANMRAAMSRFGAVLVGDALPAAKQFFIEVGVIFDGLGERVKPAVDAISKHFNSAFTITGMGDKVLAFIDKIIGALANFDGSKMSGEANTVAGGLQKIGNGLRDVWNAMPDFVSVLSLGWKALVFLAEHADTVVKLLPLLAAGFILVKTAQMGANIAAAAAPALRLAELAVQKRLIATNQQLAAAITSQTGALTTQTGAAAGNTGAKTANATATTTAATANTRGAAATGANTAAANANTVATGRATIAQRLFAIGSTMAAVAARGLSAALTMVGHAFKAIPVIGWIAVIIGGLVLAYQKFEWFRNIVDGIWDGIQAVIGGAVSFIADNILPILSKAWDTIVSAFSPIVTALQEGWAMITGAASEAKDSLSPIAEAFKSGFDAVSAAATSLWEVIQPVFSGIATALQVAWSVIQPIIGFLVNLFGTVLKTQFTVLVNVFKIGFAAIALGIRVVAAIITTAAGIIANVIRGIATAAQFVWNIISTAFSAIGKIISMYVNVWRTIITTAFNVIRTVVTTVINAVRTVITAVFSRIASTVSSVMSRIRSFVQAGIRAVQAAFALVSGVVSKVIGFFGRLVTGVAGKVREVVSKVAEIPGKVTGAIGDLAGTLYRKGGEIIGQLAQGIRDAVGKVTDAIGSVISAVTDRLPGSPVKKGKLRVINRGYAGGKIVEMLADGISASRGLASRAMEDVTSDIADYVPGSPVKKGRLRRFNKGAAGKKLADMFAKGLLDGAGAIRKATSGALRGVNKGLKGKELKAARKYIASQTKKLRAAAQIKWNKNKTAATFVQDITKALQGGAGNIDKFVLSFQKKMNNLGVSAKAAKSAQAYIKTQTKGLKSLATQYANVSNKIAEQQKIIEQLTQARDQFVSSTKDMVMATGNLASIAGKLGEHGIGFLNPKRIQAELDKAKAAASKFLADMQALRAKGFTDDMLQQLVAAGIGDAKDVAAMLATASKEEIAGVVNSFQGLQTEAAKLANWGANEFYTSGIQIAQGMLKGLQSQQAALLKAINKMANNMVKALKKKLKIKSPSRVMIDMFTNVGRGAVIGADKGFDTDKISDTFAAGGMAAADAFVSKAMIPSTKFSAPNLPTLPPHSPDNAGTTNNVNKEYNVTVNNPTPEPASESLPRVMRQIDFVGG